MRKILFVMCLLGVMVAPAVADVIAQYDFNDPDGAGPLVASKDATLEASNVSAAAISAWADSSNDFANSGGWKARVTSAGAAVATFVVTVDAGWELSIESFQYDYRDSLNNRPENVTIDYHTTATGWMTIGSDNSSNGFPVDGDATQGWLSDRVITAPANSG